MPNIAPELRRRRDRAQARSALPDRRQNGLGVRAQRVVGGVRG